MMIETNAAPDIEIKHIKINNQIRRLDGIINRISWLNQKISGSPLTSPGEQEIKKLGGGIGNISSVERTDGPSLQDFLDHSPDNICEKVNSIDDLISELEERLF